MVGNDVVDLRDRDSDPATLHPRFDARVFDSEERRLLDSDESQTRTLRWRLWASKEAAYKAVKRLRPQAIFSPSRFHTEFFGSEDASTRHGIVRSSDGICDVTVEERDGIVHAVARIVSPAAPRRPPARVLLSGVQRRLSLRGTSDPSAESRVVRAFTRARVADALGVDPAAITIEKRGRIPELRVAGEPATFALSLSHHGEAVGFACELAVAHTFAAVAASGASVSGAFVPTVVGAAGASA